jgi:hypothetical protein
MSDNSHSPFVKEDFSRRFTLGEECEGIFNIE